MFKLMRLFRWEYGRMGISESSFSCFLWFRIIANAELNYYIGFGARAVIIFLFAYLAFGRDLPEMEKASTKKIIHSFSIASLSALFFFYADDAYVSLMKLRSLIMGLL